MLFSVSHSYWRDSNVKWPRKRKSSFRRSCLYNSWIFQVQTQFDFFLIWWRREGWYRGGLYLHSPSIFFESRDLQIPTFVLKMVSGRVLERVSLKETDKDWELARVVPLRYISYKVFETQAKIFCLIRFDFIFSRKTRNRMEKEVKKCSLFSTSRFEESYDGFPSPNMI